MKLSEILTVIRDLLVAHLDRSLESSHPPRNRKSTAVIRPLIKENGHPFSYPPGFVPDEKAFWLFPKWELDPKTGKPLPFWMLDPVTSKKSNVLTLRENDHSYYSTSQGQSASICGQSAFATMKSSTQT